MAKRKSEKDRKTKLIVIRVRESMKKEFDKKAKESELTISGLGTYIITQWLKEQKK